MSQRWPRTPLPADWPKIRAHILKRDPRCTLHLDVCTTRSEQVDHINDPADHRPENLRGVCEPCHRKRTHAQAAEGRARRNPRRTQPPHPGITRGGG